MSIEPDHQQLLVNALETLEMAALLASEPDPLTEDEISTLEEQLGADLPADYRWFLATYGASGAAQGTTQITTAEGNRYEVRNFTGKATGTVPSIARNLDFFGYLLSEAELPIADDLMGNLITLNALTNQVAFVPRPDDYPPRAVLAESFTDLITRLEPYVYDD